MKLEYEKAMGAMLTVEDGDHIFMKRYRGGSNTTLTVFGRLTIIPVSLQKQYLREERAFYDRWDKKAEQYNRKRSVSRNE